jgi:uncharacterized protein (TIGR03032 family)
MQQQTTATQSVEILGSPDLCNWLQQEQISLAFTTYQTNRLFLVGSKPNGRLAINERLFDKPMGLYAKDDSLYMSTRYQIWRFDNLLEPGNTYNECDSEATPPEYRLYIPRTAYTTGDLNVHDVVAISGESEREGIVFVNTDFSCLATLSPNYSFVPLWQPPFISKLAAEDRCHLNGLALVDGQPAYVTACSATDTAAGWRNERENGGVAIDIRTNDIIATGLSMPHSPRWYRGKLWLLNSGTGELGYIEEGKFTPITFCPGFVRGLAFWKNFALVGLSKLRSTSFTGLELERRLAAQNNTPQCGLVVIDLNSGNIVHWLHIGSIVEELFDVVVLPGVQQPRALGFQNDEIDRLITFPNSGGVVITKPTAHRPSIGTVPPVAGIPRSESKGVENNPQLPITNYPLPITHYQLPITQIKYQRVYHLNISNSIDYDALTFPSIKKRWQTYQQRGELLGVSASISGTMVGFIIAELLPDRTAELLSLLVLPDYRQQGVGTKLINYLERELIQQGCSQITVAYQATALTATALEPLLRKLNWQPPQATFLLAKTTTEKIAAAPWLTRYPLPAEFTVFPWHELTTAEAESWQQRQDYPSSLNPFTHDPRLEPLNSLGLRYRGEVIGWMLTHRVAPDTIRYSSLFVSEKFQKLGRGISLLAESIQRQIASSVTNCTFSVARENAQMLKFVDRHLQPYLTGMSESRICGKLLEMRDI